MVKKYTNTRTKQVMWCLDDQERAALTQKLTSIMAWMKTSALPVDWNDHDAKIFPGMFKLNSTIGSFIDVEPITVFGLGIDPTQDQVKKLNLALVKLRRSGLNCPADLTNLDYSSQSSGNVSEAQMKSRMNQRRSDLIAWVTTNIAALKARYVNDPIILKNLVGKSTNTEDRKMSTQITNLVNPPKNDDLGELFA